MNLRVVPLLLALSLVPEPSLARSSASRLDEMMPLLSDLAARGSYGVTHTEHAAFIVEDADGDLQCVLWPFSADFQRAHSEAPIPDNVVAIAHTHPRCCRDVSAHDVREARRLGITIIAVSMGTMSTVDEAGRRGERRGGVSWSRHADEDRRCREER
jgi:hypothetical protein